MTTAKALPTPHWTRATSERGRPQLRYLCGCTLPVGCSPAHVATVTGHVDPQGDPYWVIDWDYHATLHMKERPASTPHISYPTLDDATVYAQRLYEEGVRDQADLDHRTRTAICAQHEAIDSFLAARPALPKAA